MTRFILILIERVEQCLTVLNKLYDLLAYINKYHPHDIRHAVDNRPLSNEDRLLIEVADNDDPLLTITEACEQLGVVRATLYKLRMEGFLPKVQKGVKGVRFRQSDIEKLRKWYSVPKGKV